MRTLKEALQLLPDSGREFQGDCAGLFSTGVGARLLQTLINFRSPYDSPMDHRNEMDPTVTAFIAGQKDIISTLVHLTIEPGDTGQFNPHSVAKSDAHQNTPP